MDKSRLISKEDRQAALLDFGFPEIFIRNVGKIPELAYRVADVEGAYFYLPGILHYSILEGCTLVPIFDCGESFYVLALKEGRGRIIHFELENDQVYSDYGHNCALLLMDIMIQYFDDHIDDDLSPEQFTKVAGQLGFIQAETLFTLRNLPIDKYNDKYEDHEAWRLEIAKSLHIL